MEAVVRRWSCSESGGKLEQSEAASGARTAVPPLTYQESPAPFRRWCCTPRRSAVLLSLTAPIQCSSMLKVASRSWPRVAKACVPTSSRLSGSCSIFVWGKLYVVYEALHGPLAPRSGTGVVLPRPAPVATHQWRSARMHRRFIGHLHTARGPQYSALLLSALLLVARSWAKASSACARQTAR